ncbi:hypothetical protein [uncultured Bacteroides sp.]|uniref:hypothetical protein n=1 Tax=uncultured Bacteroides sp. TaxID=162156 RepID=UPI0025936639|nr:hypothetical protein [uncultured Bacteroides sp.]
MKLYVFNPDADMALGNNEENYMAPATIRRMAEDLALLPIWYARPGSGVLAPSAYNADYLKQMQQLFRLDVQLVTEPELPDYADMQVIPWGWNPAIRKRMLKGGVAESLLPSAADLSRYRRLASRANVRLLYACGGEAGNMSYLCGGEGVLVTADDFANKGREAVQELLLRWQDCGCICKSLWSGSGKGLCWYRQEEMEKVIDWCCRALRTDGAFWLEPIYNKVEDFAMEFYADGKGGVRFVGYSRFVTDGKGAYRGNLLATDMQVEEWIQTYVPLEAFHRLRESVRKGLAALGTDYTGFLGVDMMVCRQEKGHPYAVNPCVEVNLRMNMGIVAHTFCDRFVAPGGEGFFSIEYFPAQEALQEQHARDVLEHPLRVEQGRVVSGYLPLIPVTPRSRYRAFVRVE